MGQDVYRYMLPLSQLTYYLIPSAILQKFWLIPANITTTAFPMLTSSTAPETRPRSSVSTASAPSSCFGWSYPAS